MRAYQHLAALQGNCIPVLEAAGVLGLDEVVVAVSGGQRITSCDDAAADDSRRLRWEALESLRASTTAGCCMEMWPRATCLSGSDLR